MVLIYLWIRIINLPNVGFEMKFLLAKSFMNVASPFWPELGSERDGIPGNPLEALLLCPTDTHSSSL